MIEIINVLPSMGMGMLAGIVTGMLPGPGPLTAIMLLWLWLTKLDVINLLVFFFALCNTTQYFASVSAIVYGVMGDITSQPAVTHGHRLFQQGRGLEALVWSSTGSFIASVVAIVGFALILLMIKPMIPWLLQDNVYFTLVSSTLIIVIATTGRPILATMLMAIGMLLGKVGFDPVFRERFLTMGIPDLDGGIPMFALVIGFIALPVLIREILKVNDHGYSVNAVTCTLRQRLILLLRVPYAAVMARASALGFILGLIPGSSYRISSNLAAQMECRHSDHRSNRDMRALIAAETANNAGSVSMLIPMLLFAIPLTPVEGVILSLAEIRGLTNNTAEAFLDQHVWIVFASLMLINFANWFAAGLWFNYAVMIYQRWRRWIYAAAIAVCIICVLWFAAIEMAIMVNVVTIILAFVAGWIINDERIKFVMIYGYIIVDVIFYQLYRYYQLFY